MLENPTLRSVSLFVPDLEEAGRRYAEVFRVQPARGDATLPSPHPFGAGRPPVVFDLGGVKLALYQADGRTTRGGDVGIGVELDAPPAALAERATRHDGQVFHGPARLADGRELAVFVLPGAHYFEVVGPNKVDSQL